MTGLRKNSPSHLSVLFGSFEGSLLAQCGATEPLLQGRLSQHLLPSSAFLPLERLSWESLFRNLDHSCSLPRKLFCTLEQSKGPVVPLKALLGLVYQFCWVSKVLTKSGSLLFSHSQYTSFLDSYLYCLTTEHSHTTLTIRCKRYRSPQIYLVLRNAHSLREFWLF